MDLLINTLRSLAYIFVNPYLIFILVVLSIVLFTRNKKLVLMQKMVIGEEQNSAIELTVSQVVIGIFGGVLVSSLLAYFGILFADNSGIQILFVLSMFLMFINSRFVCFSYSGAVLGLISIVLSVISNGNTPRFHIDIMMLMSFIGIFHIVEGIIVAADGERGSIPVFSNRNGQIQGGYSLKREWITPIAMMFAFSAESLNGISSQMKVADWWPIISDGYTISLLSTMIISFLPLFAVLGYSSVTFTRGKKNKAMSSGIFIICYGILLTLVSQLCKFGIAGEILVVILAPAGHELMLRGQKYIESKRSPIFISDTGICVLEIIQSSQVYNLGIRIGDKITDIDGTKIFSEIQAYELLKKGIREIHLIKPDGETSVYKSDQIVKEEAGLVLVPKTVKLDKVVPVENEKFSEVLDKLQKK